MKKFNEPIRILHVFGEMNRGGAETLIMNIYRNIDREKIQFDFVVHTDKKCAYDDEIVSLGGKIHRVPKYRGKNHFEYVREWKKFIDNHSEYKIMHSHIITTAIFYLGYAKKRGMTTIVHSHSISSGKGMANKVKDIFQIPLKWSNKLDYRFACSKTSGKWLFGDKQFKIINNAIDSEKFAFSVKVRDEIRTKLNISDEFVVGNVARFHPLKNHLFLLDIFSEIAKSKPNAILLLLGDGDFREQIEIKINELNLTNNVKILGAVENVNDYLMAADLFLFPSLSEGLGVVLIEAQATGLECLTSDKVVPIEAKVTDLLEYVPLEKSAKIWAEKCLGHATGYERKNMTDIIVANGYDIKTVTEELEKFYLQIGE